MAIVTRIFIASTLLLLVSCSSRPDSPRDDIAAVEAASGTAASQDDARSGESLALELPPGLVIATDAQKQFIERLADLQRGMSPESVKRELGPPEAGKSATMSYSVIEDRVEGGYYISAILTFSKGGLANAKVSFGHESRQLRAAE